jgi:hypothetical protein
LPPSGSSAPTTAPTINPFNIQHSAFQHSIFTAYLQIFPQQRPAVLVQRHAPTRQRIIAPARPKVPAQTNAPSNNFTTHPLKFFTPPIMKHRQIRRTSGNHQPQRNTTVRPTFDPHGIQVVVPQGLKPMCGRG